jgi:O-antigen/teichoic acid export membrane protein
MLFALAGAVCVAGFWPSAEPIIRLLYGDRFAPAAGATRLLVVGAALMSLTVLGIFLLTAAGKQRYYPGIALLGLALNVGLNLVLIPKMSYDGAAVSTVVTSAVTVVLLWLVIERFMPVKGLLPIRPLATLVLLTSAVAAVGQLAVDRWPDWWPAVSVVAVLAFVPFVYVVRMVGNAPESADAGAVSP